MAAQVFQMGQRADLKALVRGTQFQVRVWRALLKVPPGAVVSYGHLAAAIGQPSAARAVGTAVGSNPLAFLIPCHRVIRETGVMGQYRWGWERKRALLGWEGARRR
jgi:AraC family transcriptional regulator of adaptative response/methylated-DNA-[protein]-cysteine methyltransferase